jgi:hypothetical protein
LIERKEERARGRRQPPTRARGREAAQPPERSARGEAKRRGGAAAHKRREKRGEGNKRRRRSRRRKREKKRERRAAQPPVSKRSRKQRFLFFCWGLFSWGAFSFFLASRHPFLFRMLQYHCNGFVLLSDACVRFSTVCRDSVATIIFNFQFSLFNLNSPLVAPSVILRRSFGEIPATT